VDVSLNIGGAVKVDQVVPPSYPFYNTFESGTEVQLEAMPAEGYVFTSWTGNVADPNSPRTTVTIDCRKMVVANFNKPDAYKLTVDINGEGFISPREGVYDYKADTIVNIEATPEKGWRFAGWTGDAANHDAADTTVTLNTDKTLTANFYRVMHKLTMQSNGEGTTIPPAGNFQYSDGTTVTITAKPEKGWRFDSWTTDTGEIESTSAAITINSDVMYTANFSRVTPIGWYLGSGFGGLLIVGVSIWFARRRNNLKKADG
jgi:uncharacterized repeat protein (TIGR02543 family)